MAIAAANCRAPRRNCAPALCKHSGWRQGLQRMISVVTCLGHMRAHDPTDLPCICWKTNASGFCWFPIFVPSNQSIASMMCHGLKLPWESSSATGFAHSNQEMHGVLWSLWSLWVDPVRCRRFNIIQLASLHCPGDRRNSGKDEETYFPASTDPQSLWQRWRGLCIRLGTQCFRIVWLVSCDIMWLYGWIHGCTNELWQRATWWPWREWETATVTNARTTCIYNYLYT